MFAAMATVKRHASSVTGAEASFKSDLGCSDVGIVASASPREGTAHSCLKEDVASCILNAISF